MKRLRWKNYSKLNLKNSNKEWSSVFQYEWKRVAHSVTFPYYSILRYKIFQFQAQITQKVQNATDHFHNNPPKRGKGTTKSPSSSSSMQLFQHQRGATEEPKPRTLLANRTVTDQNPLRMAEMHEKQHRLTDKADRWTLKNRYSVENSFASWKGDQHRRWMKSTYNQQPAETTRSAFSTYQWR